MILIVTTREHRDTHECLFHEPELDVDVVTYEQVLGRARPYSGTHVFTDLDRLPSWRVHEAALLYRELKQAGTRTLNDPARFLGRFGLLKALRRAGINSFDAYRAEDLQQPRRWPVFLRLEGNHAAPVSGLLHDEQELEHALQRAVEEGAPRSALLIIEFAAEPHATGIYRKLSVFRVADRLLGYTCVHDDNWLVKYGKPDLAAPELYDEEYSLVAENPYGPALMQAFDAAGIEYGRADFGLVGGKPQIYEINSNPFITLRPSYTNERRRESTALFRSKYIEALKAIEESPRTAWQVRSTKIARRSGAFSSRALRALARLTDTRAPAAS